MKNIQIALCFVIFGSLCSCNGNSQKNSQQKAITKDEKILNELAYVTLENYEYRDNTNGVFSGRSNDGRTIKIEGTTNFPDETMIDIETSGFLVSTRENGMPDTYAEAKVQNGRFSAVLKPWNVTDSIEFRVLSKKQSKELLSLIGDNGEKLKLKDDNKPDLPGIVIFRSGNIAVNDSVIRELKGKKETTYSIQEASELQKPYEKVLAQFVKCWSKNDWESMTKYCENSQSPDDLSSKFDIIHILGFEISGSHEGVKLPSGNTLMEVEFLLDIKSRNPMKGIQRKNLKANVVLKNGAWGVNSISVLRDLYN